MSDRDMSAQSTSIGDAQQHKQQPQNNNTQLTKLEMECEEMFAKLGLYMDAEIRGSASEYELLRKLNNAAADKYAAMADKATALVTMANSMQQKFDMMQPYLQQIDALEDHIAKLEEVTRHLDSYSKRLENQFRLMYR